MLSECRAITRSIEKSISNLKNKGDVLYVGADGLPTTRLDKIAEDAALKSIRKLKLPCQVLSEEAGLVKISKNPEYTLVLDPIDGTYNAVLGIPYYAVSIAKYENDEVTFGYVKNLCNGDEFWADKKSYCNGKRIRINETEKLSDAVVCVGSRPITPQQYAEYKKLFLGCKRLRIMGAIALDLCYLAKGTFDVVADFHIGMKTVDYAAAMLIIEKSGGFIRTPENEKPKIEFNLKNRSNLVAATNEKLFRGVIKTLA